MKKPFKQRSDFTPVISPDGRFVVTVVRDIALFDVDARKRVWRTKPFKYPQEVAFDHLGERLAVKSQTGQIVVLDVATGDVIADFANEEDGEGSNLIFSPCGKLVIDGSWDGVLTVRSVDNQCPVAQHVFEHQSLSRLSTWGDFVFVHHGERFVEGVPDRDDFIARWCWPMDERRYDVFPYQPRGLRAFGIVSGDEILVSNIEVGHANRLTLVDLEGEKHTWDTADYGQVRAIARIPHTETVACASDSHVFFLDLNAGDLHAGIEHARTYGFSFSIDGSRVGFGSYEEAMVEDTLDFLPDSLK